MQRVDALLETFEQAYARVVARQNAGGRRQLGEQSRDLRETPIHRLRERLHDEVLRVAVHDQRRQPVRFAMDEPVRGGVDPKRVAVPDGGCEPLTPEVGPGRHVRVGEHPDRNF